MNAITRRRLAGWSALLLLMSVVPLLALPAGADNTEAWAYFEFAYDNTGDGQVDGVVAGDNRPGSPYHEGGKNNALIPELGGKVHVSCSDNFPGGYSDSGNHPQPEDKVRVITFFIEKHKSNGQLEECANNTGTTTTTQATTTTQPTTTTTEGTTTTTSSTTTTTQPTTTTTEGTTTTTSSTTTTTSSTTTTTTQPTTTTTEGTTTTTTQPTTTTTEGTTTTTTAPTTTVSVLGTTITVSPSTLPFTGPGNTGSALALGMALAGLGGLVLAAVKREEEEEAEIRN